MICPTIILPGFATSTLVDRATLPSKKVWRPFDVVKPNKENMKKIVPYPHHPEHSADGSARIAADVPFVARYKKLCDDLRAELRKQTGHTAVYPFAYDWRLPLELIEERLDRLIGEIIERTRLMDPDGKIFGPQPKVNLIGHSMGGLIAAGYLASGRAGDTRLRYWECINKLITLGTPYAGSTAIVYEMIHGLHRLTLRLIPATYYLLPDPHICGLDLFNRRTWPAQVIASLDDHAAQVKLQDDLLATFLASARAYRTKLKLLRGTQLPWLVVTGLDQKTRTMIGYQRSGDQFDFAATGQDGDGYVLLPSAMPDFLKENRHLSSIRISAKDYVAGEFGIRMLNALGLVQLHTNLPRMRATRRAVMDFLQR